MSDDDHDREKEGRNKQRIRKRETPLSWKNEYQAEMRDDDSDIDDEGYDSKLFFLILSKVIIMTKCICPSTKEGEQRETKVKVIFISLYKKMLSHERVMYERCVCVCDVGVVVSIRVNNGVE